MQFLYVQDISLFQPLNYLELDGLVVFPKSKVSEWNQKLNSSSCYWNTSRLSYSSRHLTTCDT